MNTWKVALGKDEMRLEDIEIVEDGVTEQTQLTWQSREGRLLTYELVIDYILSNHANFIATDPSRKIYRRTSSPQVLAAVVGQIHIDCSPMQMMLQVRTKASTLRLPAPRKCMPQKRHCAKAHGLPFLQPHHCTLLRLCLFLPRPLHQVQTLGILLLKKRKETRAGAVRIKT